MTRACSAHNRFPFHNLQYGNRLFVNILGLLIADFNPLRVASLSRGKLHTIREFVVL
jgi:hypothetical protein